MKIVNLASGSKGNCTYINSGNTHILVDVGVCFVEIMQKLETVGVNPSQISAILITHEHIDHIKGLQAFLKNYPEVQIFAHPKTMIKIEQKIYIPMGNKNHIISDFYLGDLTVSPFSLSHDSSHCLGFSFYENGKKFSIATDTGYVSDELLNNLLGSDLVFLESNYDQAMLYYCEKYPYVLKERIKSKNGHLSNDDCAVLIGKLVVAGTKCFALAHISENSNTYDIAKKATSDYLTRNNLLDNNVVIEVLHQYLISRVYII